VTWNCGNRHCPTHASPFDQCVPWQLAPIARSVGVRGANRAADVTVIQGALNRVSASCGGPAVRLDTDGEPSPLLFSAIKQFQAIFFGTTTPDGRVDPNGRTYHALAKKLNVKRISVLLGDQRVEAVENGCRVHNFDCVTGDGSNPTNPGVFTITRKDRIHRSQQFDVQMNFAMFFDHGKALHQYHGIIPLALIRQLKSGSDFFGSHGCVRLDEKDAATLFDFAPLHTRVTVF